MRRRMSISCLKRSLLNLWTRDLRYLRRFRVEIVSMSRQSLETMTWKIFFVSKFFSRLLRFSFFSEKFSQSSSTRELNFNFCSEDNYFSTSHRLFFAFLMNCCLHSSERRTNFDTTKKKFFLFCSFHFCFWKKRFSRSTLIFWDLDSRFWTYLFSQSDSRSLDDETNRRRDCSYQIDIQSWNQVLLIFLII
jgi:hypothetical protein